MSKANTLQTFSGQAESLTQDIKNLLVSFREFLDKEQIEALFEAENDLYDAMDCLADFVEGCQTEAQVQT